MKPTAGDRTIVETLQVGLRSLDRTLPLRRGSLYLVGGPEGIGRTTLLVSVATCAAKAGYRCLFVASVESELAMRVRIEGALDGITIGGIARDLSDSDSRATRGATSWSRQLPLRLVAQPLISLDELERVARPAGRFDLLLVDDLHQITGTHGDNLGLMLRSLARWLRVPVVGTVRTAVPDRAKGEPLLSDFPKHLVRAANASVMLYRTGYFIEAPKDLTESENEDWNRTTVGMVLRQDWGFRTSFVLSLDPTSGPVMRSGFRGRGSVA